MDFNFKFDSETLQPSDIIRDHGFDPYVDPDVFHALTRIDDSSPGPASAKTPSHSPTLSEDSLVDDLDQTMCSTSEFESAHGSNTEMDRDNSPAAEQCSSPPSENCLPLPSPIFAPAFRVIRRVRLMVSTPGSDEQAVFYVDPPSSPMSDYSNDA